MNNRSHVLAQSIASVTSARARTYSPGLARDRVLQALLADLLAARTAAGKQEDVAERMWTTKSAVCRLESGRPTRPTLRTIESYALAVSARIEIRVRPLG